MALGLQLLYRGYLTARMSVVAPVSSVVFGVVPVLWGAMAGALPGAWVVAGMAVAVLALAPTTWTPRGGGSVRTALMLGVGSGALFAVAFVLMSELSEQSGLLPLWAQRVAGFTVLACAQPFEKSPLIVLALPARPWAWAAGACSFVGLASLQLGYALPGSDAVASVAVAQFATVLVVLSVIFNGDRLRWWQSLGVLASGIGVGIMAGAA
jgi:hypothetical protein